MTLKLLTKQLLEFLSLKGGCAGSSESTLVKIPHCWKSHVAAHLSFQDPNNLRMSQRLSDKIAQMQRQKEEEAELKRVEKEKKKQEHDEKVKKERERQQEKLRRLNTSESLGIECKFAVNTHWGVVLFTWS